MLEFLLQGLDRHRVLLRDHLVSLLGITENLSELVGDHGAVQLQSHLLRNAYLVHTQVGVCDDGCSSSVVLLLADHLVLEEPVLGLLTRDHMNDSWQRSALTLAVTTATRVGVQSLLALGGCTEKVLHLLEQRSSSIDVAVVGNLALGPLQRLVQHPEALVEFVHRVVLQGTVGEGSLRPESRRHHRDSLHGPCLCRRLAGLLQRHEGLVLEVHLVES